LKDRSRRALIAPRGRRFSRWTIGLEALTAEAVREAESRVEAAGCRVLSSKPSLECIKAGVTFATPEGLRFEIHTPIRNGIYDRRHPTYGVGPSRLDHANLMTPIPTRHCGI
jgi:catechol 2,3-dioxygenase